LSPVLARHALELLLAELLAALEQGVSGIVYQLARGRLARKHVSHAVVEAVSDDLDLFVTRPLEVGALPILQGTSPLVLFWTLTREDARIDHYDHNSGGNLERTVANVAGLLAEDESEELLFWTELNLSLGCDLADVDIAGLHHGAY